MAEALASATPMQEVPLTGDEVNSPSGTDSSKLSKTKSLKRFLKLKQKSPRSSGGVESSVSVKPTPLEKAELEATEKTSEERMDGKGTISKRFHLRMGGVVNDGNL